MTTATRPRDVIAGQLTPIVLDTHIPAYVSFLNGPLRMYRRQDRTGLLASLVNTSRCCLLSGDALGKRHPPALKKNVLKFAVLKFRPQHLQNYCLSWVDRLCTGDKEIVQLILRLCPMIIIYKLFLGSAFRITWTGMWPNHKLFALKV